MYIITDGISTALDVTKLNKSHVSEIIRSVGFIRTQLLHRKLSDLRIKTLQLSF